MRTGEKDRFTVKSGELISEAESELDSIRSSLGEVPWLGKQVPAKDDEAQKEVARYARSLAPARRANRS